MKISTQSISMLIIGLLLGFVGSVLISGEPMNNVPQMNSSGNDALYEDVDGFFSFMYPSEQVVICEGAREETSCTVTSMDEDSETPVPDVRVKIMPHHFSVTTFDEEQDLEYVMSIIESFQMNFE